MKLLVTGGAGFIGSCFVRHILNTYSDYKVVNLDALTYCGNLENLNDLGIRKSIFEFMNGAVYVLDGEIELHFDAQKFTVKKGEMLIFKKDTQHKVLGIKNSKFILIKI